MPVTDKKAALQGGLYIFLYNCTYFRYNITVKNKEMSV